MRRLPAKSGLKSGNRTPTGSLGLKYLRFAGLFASKRQFLTKIPGRKIADPGRPKPQTLISRRNLVACHGISSVKKGLGRPKTGSALHHLVTSVSVKKALTDSAEPKVGARGGYTPRTIPVRPSLSARPGVHRNAARAPLDG
jgi:hypothetical protein